ncbi:hypothetical protein D770_21725 [Flammeovirgaceae bacterium 311]|nr:hypothetical protein D770_21725 [Flammeovirgaceae bacterium 311]
MVRKFKRLQWLVILPVIAFLCQGCERCRSEELPMLNVRMQFQEEGRYILRSDLLETRLILSNEVLQLPFSLTADTTVYDFLKMDGQVWRLAIAYNRRTGFEDTGCGFFLEFINARVLPETTFSSVQLQPGPIEWFVTVTQ